MQYIHLGLVKVRIQRSTLGVSFIFDLSKEEALSVSAGAKVLERILRMAPGSTAKNVVKGYEKIKAAVFEELEGSPP